MATFDACDYRHHQIPVRPVVAADFATICVIARSVPTRQHETNKKEGRIIVHAWRYSNLVGVALESAQIITGSAVKN